MAPITWTLSIFLNGLFAFFVVLVPIIIGILILFKYHKYKTKIFLYWGVSLIGIYVAWAGAATSFVYALFTGHEIPEELYMFIASFFIPLFIVTWIYGLTELILKDKRKILVIIMLVYTISWDIFLIFALTINPEIIGTVENFDGNYSIIALVYLASMNLFMTGTGILFALNSRKSINKEQRIKALLIAGAYITYLLGGMIDAGETPSDIELILVRLLIMSGPILYYFGLFMPPRIAKLLIKGWSQEELDIIPDHVDNVQDFFLLLQSRPKKITEEEITFYREQKICLVCKNKAIGRTFIHECDALYCLKCADALIELENMCWVCENALDKTKDVKMVEWIEDNVAHILPEEDEPKQKN